MERDVETITADIRQAADDIVLYKRQGFTNDDAIARFHNLREEQRRALREQRPQWIYFVHAPSVGRVKIGITSNLDLRFKSLANASPVQLVLVARFRGTVADEAELHRKWAHLRCNGEWFIAAPELLASIDRAA